MTNLLIGYPAIPAAYRTLTANQTAATGKDVYSTVAGGRGTEFRAATATTTPLTFWYDLGSGVTASANFFYVPRASRLKKSGVNTLSLAGSSQPKTSPSVIGNCKLWLESDYGLTANADGTITAWLDQSGQGYNVTGTSTPAPIRTRSDNKENLVPYSEQFDNAAWTKTQSSISANATTNPLDLATTADKLVENVAVGVAHNMTCSVAEFINGQVYTYYCYLKGAGRHRVRTTLAGTAFAAAPLVEWNLTTGAVTTSSGGASSATITQVGGVGSTWYRCSFTATAGASGAGTVGISLLDATGAASYTGDGTSGCYCYGAQITRSGADTTYIGTTTYAAYRGINGMPAVHFSKSSYFDFTNPANLKITGDRTHYVVVRPHKDAEDQAVINSHSPPNTGYMLSVYTTLKPQYASSTGGVTTTLTATNAITQNAAHVIGIIIASTTGTFRTDVAANGSGAVGVPANQTYYRLGYNAASANAMQGEVCAVYVFSDDLTSDQRDQLEEYISKKWFTTPLAGTTALDAETLIGPQSEDFLETFTASTAYRYWNFWAGADVSNDYPVNKVMFGTGFDLGRDPVYPRQIQRRLLAKSNRTQTYGFSFSWEGITDATLASFMSSIFRFKDAMPIVLYTTSYHDVLNEAMAVHCKIASGSFTKVAPDSNKITLEFEEEI